MWLRKRGGEGVRSAGARCRRTAIRWSERGGRGWNDRQVVPRGALLIYARVTGSKISVDLRRAVYRRLISCSKEDLPSALTACTINLVAQRATLLRIARLLDLRRDQAGGSRDRLLRGEVNEGHIERAFRILRFDSRKFLPKSTFSRLL